MNIYKLSVIVLVISMLGYSCKPPSGASELEKPDSELLVRLGDSIIGGTAARLMIAVTHAIDSVGHAGAVGYCAEQAQHLTTQGLEQGWELRRISVKNRHRGNKASQADRSALLQMAEQKEAGGSIQRVDADSVHYYKPIMVAAPCLACHGSPQQMVPDVAKAIKSRYPDDLAVDYKEGDLRGAWKLSLTRETLVTLRSK